MAAEFVKPFRKNRAAKNDRNDAEAVLTAVRQPNMRFVAVKSVEHQACLSWHRMRQGWSEERTALINRLRGLARSLGGGADTGVAGAGKRCGIAAVGAPSARPNPATPRTARCSHCHL